MEVNLNIINTILILGAFQGILLGIVLLSIRRGNRLANKILAVILTLFSISIIIHTTAHGNFSFHFPFHKDIVLIIYMLMAPLLYFYLLALTKPDFKFQKKDWIHFLPIIFGLIVTFILKPSDEHNLIENSDEQINLLILAIFVIVLTIIYLVASIKILLKHSRNIKETFSSIEKINLNWLRFLIIGYVITWIGAISAEGYGGGSEPWDYHWILVSAFMYSIGIMGLRQPEIFSGIVTDGGIINRTDENKKNAVKKYEKSTLTKEQADLYFDRLKQMISKDKPYLENDITLPELAKNLSMPTHHLSQIINERLNQNFFEFINSHRVEESKRLLKDPDNQNLSIAALSFEAGFNSISAFNSAFKKHAGITPSQFRDSIISKK